MMVITKLMLTLILMVMVRMMMVIMMMAVLVMLMIMIDLGKSRADLWQFAANVALEVFNKIFKSNDDHQ